MDHRPLSDLLGEDPNGLTSDLSFLSGAEAQQALRQAIERFGLVRDAAQVGFWFCDLPFDKLLWDRRVKEHFWLSPDAEVTIAMFYERLHPDDRDRTRRAIEESIANNARYDIEYRTVAAGNGEEKWIRAIGRTFCDAQNRPIRFDGVTLDITERKRAEEARWESEARFRNLADAAPAMFWVTEPDGSCSFLSHGWYEFTGQTKQEGLSKTGLGWLDAVHPDDRKQARRIFLVANKARRPFSLDYRLRRHDGEYRWAIDAGRPRVGSNGEFLGYIGSVLDISDRVSAEEALRAS
ncbi:MAG: PAS domain-containing protein, partial [Nitrospira sp.]